MLNVIMNNIVDEDFIERDAPYGLEAMVAWWEDRRPYYNYAVLFSMVIPMIIYWKGLMMFGVIIGIIESIIVLFIANMFYSLGWGVEIFFRHHRGIDFWSGRTRKTLFIIGMVFSIALTFFMYFSTLAIFVPFD